jgi:hypothetical protein
MTHESEVIYRRELPGGGFVAIEATPTRDFLGRRRYRGAVVVERRGPARRSGHHPPVIASAVATTTASLFHTLFPVTHSNVRVASECLALARERARLRALR